MLKDVVSWDTLITTRNSGSRTCLDLCMRECHRRSSSLCLSTGILRKALSLSTKDSKQMAKRVQATLYSASDPWRWAAYKNMNIKTIITIAILLLLVPVGNCSFAASEEKIKTETEHFIRFGYDLFEKNTSNPEKDIIETTTNKHNSAQTDEWHTVYFDGLIAKFYRAKSAPKDFVTP